MLGNDSGDDLLVIVVGSHYIYLFTVIRCLVAGYVMDAHVLCGWRKLSTIGGSARYGYSECPAAT
jgi:hypothetical protein